MIGIREKIWYTSRNMIGTDLHRSIPPCAETHAVHVSAERYVESIIGNIKTNIFRAFRSRYRR